MMVQAQQTLLSDYETLRARNIERNNARLRALGLISSKEEVESNKVAWKKKSPQSMLKATKKIPTSKKSDAKRSLSESNAGIYAGSRKSRRLQGESPECRALLDEDEPSPRVSEGETHQSLEGERQARIQECREIRLRRALEVSQAGADRAARENPTASYEHCLMRVRTMTEKALANRVKAIERATGKHCVVKMAIFKSCLQDEGMWELANQASHALERLKALEAPLEDD